MFILQESGGGLPSGGGSTGEAGGGGGGGGPGGPNTGPGPQAVNGDTLDNMKSSPATAPTTPMGPR